jgi:lactate permease
MAAIPIAVLLGCIAFLKMKAHYAAMLGLASALAVAVLGFGMPARLAWSAAGYGAAFGLLPIGWIVLNIIFLHQLTVEHGSFKVLQSSLMGITDDRRLQLLLIAFCFGAFFEGAAGFGTPVAVTAAILIGLGFSPLAASGLSLIANTAPVAYGALGTPVIALAAVTGLDLQQLSAMIGRQLPFFSLLVPFWLIWAFAGFRGMIEVWPAILVAGVSFAVPQFVMSNYHGPWLVDVVAAIVSMACLVGFLKVWRPRKVWTSTVLKARTSEASLTLEAVEPSAVPGTALAAAVPAAAGAGPRINVAVPGSSANRSANNNAANAPAAARAGEDGKRTFLAWAPWLILTVFVFLWGVPAVKTYLDGVSVYKMPIGTLHNLVERVPPVVAKPSKEAAVYMLNWLSATGTGILLAGVIGGLLMKYSLKGLVRMYGRTIWLVRYSLLTIMLMLALGFLTRYSGTDATLGLVFAQTGALYPLFGTLLGWLGVALTGSDTSSNVLFGGLQKISAEQLGLPSTLMAAANSSGGVMGKMIDAQSIVVASTATRWYGHEGDILRYVFFHSIALAILVGLLVSLQAYVPPFTALVVR